MSRLPLLLIGCVLCVMANAADRPNILWITSEDHGPHVGAYGDAYATTPNLDRFAARGLRYANASSNAPVCAPARTTIISGVYPPSVGAQHMRSRTPAPEWLSFFPKYLQEAGYYTSNNVKEDYNLETDDKGWDESSREAHWKNRPEGKPFFAVFNYTVTHESQIRNENKSPTHDPALAPLPPYHPDTPEVRKDWAQYYDRISLLDTFFQERLDELEEAGLAEDTIVFFYGDHGSGMPRGKRYPGWSGLHVPMMVYVPEKYRELAPAEYVSGGASQRLVSFVDLAPTMLSLVGVKPPDYHQGAAFMGEYETKAPKYSFGFRGRMDERPDFCRSVTDGRYMYVRNYMAHLPHGQHLWYQQETPTTRVWNELHRAGKLNATQAAFWEPHPRDELFDLETDPHETINLAADPEHAGTLKRLGKALDKHLLDTRDLGFAPEPMLRRFIVAGESPATALESRFAGGKNPIKSALAEVDFESEKWKKAFAKANPERRYWMLTRVLEAGEAAARSAEDLLKQALADEEPAVRVVAGECLALHASGEGLRRQALDTLVDLARFPENELILSVRALNALDHAKDAGISLPKEARTLTTEHPEIPGWASSYRLRIIERF